ncbi:MAG: 4-hydroxy-tetrahydrodipicolinate synthase [Firmicutes bacterium]|nr:4-hydroxy-tetrahydrodipicolinate synthase [Bacillota bacterium]HXL04163.1 4-hydroxy-tetrahydrodipicolinate synthase [Bacillota bacterium]
MADFGRVMTAMVTPFTPNLKVDYDRAGELAELLVKTGSDSIVVSGTTGESPTLSFEEKLDLIRVVVDAVGHDAKVIAGTGSNSTESSIELTRAAEEIGVHGIMLVVPYYNKPPQEGLITHFKTIADTTELPIILYNIPGRTGINMTPDTIETLSRVSNIVGVKEASGNLEQVTDIRRRTPRSFKIYSGDDALTLPVMAVGGEGIISVASHVAGKEIKQMIKAFEEGNVTMAAELNCKLFPLFKALFITTNPIPVKLALKLTGFDVGGVRPPLIEAGEKEAVIVEKALKDVGLLS